VGPGFTQGFVGQKMVEDEVTFSLEKTVLFLTVMKVIVNERSCCVHGIFHEIIPVLSGKVISVRGGAFPGHVR
jgi:hypothetical protein